MADTTTTDATSGFVATRESGDLHALSPFYSLSYHFGMLLGVDDFETEHAYHRGKMRLHNAWLHREGVVWGLGVRLDEANGEIRVLPGLALDGVGRELHLEGDHCLSVGAWFAKHRTDADFTFDTDANGIISFDAHVVIGFKRCLTRQVPALMEPCEGSGRATAYSREYETVELFFRPGRWQPRTAPYHRLRLVLGVDEPVMQDGAVVEPDQQVLDERARIIGLPGTEQPAAWLQAFRKFAALDVIDMRPAQSTDGSRMTLFPVGEDEPVVLADITGVRLQRIENRWSVTAGGVDPSVRPSHVATSTIQELLCRSLV